MDGRKNRSNFCLVYLDLIQTTTPCGEEGIVTPISNFSNLLCAKMTVHSLDNSQLTSFGTCS